MSEKQPENSILKDSEEWSTRLHREMVAAKLMDPSLIAFKSLALGIPEIEVRRLFEEELCHTYTTKK